MPKHVAEPPKPFRSRSDRKRTRPRKIAEKPEPRIGQIPEHGPKRPVNVSVSRDILAAAKRLKINLSEVLERELARLTEDERIRRFQEENRAAFDSYKRLVERAGVFGEELLDLDDPAV